MAIISTILPVSWCFRKGYKRRHPPPVRGQMTHNHISPFLLLRCSLSSLFRLPARTGYRKSKLMKLCSLEYLQG